jgi:FtsP/CotA-like multicopper oxidase with cupredoxin domain
MIRWNLRRHDIGARISIARRQVGTVVVIVCLSVGAFGPGASPAAAQGFVACPPTGQPLLDVPEITRDAASRTLPAVITIGDQLRRIWLPQSKDEDGVSGNTHYCATQRIRYFRGYSPVHPNERWPTTEGLAEPLPGPTLRARLGDIVQISLFNEVDTAWFGLTNDRGEQGLGCDVSTGPNGQIYPGDTGDIMPNCMHGSSTGNLHFHGTHTSPSTTGDNVFLQIRPSPRSAGQPVVTEATVREDFEAFFRKCAAELRRFSGVPTVWPNFWEDLPATYRSEQERLLRLYDATGQFQGGYGLPPQFQLWPQNQHAIERSQWPNYFVGAFPYCFELPEYLAGAGPPSANQLKMGQAPGTHWYHAHKHGSTYLNVANGMVGALIVEGPYDDRLREYYRSTPEHRNWDVEEKVLVLQQLDMTPNVLRASGGSGPQFELTSVNGRLEPVVTMRPGEVQRWRIINTSGRTGIVFSVPQGLEWRVTALDGVQLAPANYGKEINRNAQFLLSAGNRADLLVRAPTTEGDITVRAAGTISRVATDKPLTLFTVRVSHDPQRQNPDPAMTFPSEEEFPPLPAFLADIDPSTIHTRRELVFDTVSLSDPNAPVNPAPHRGRPREHTINGELFGDDIDQAMVLDTTEEWKIVNGTASPAIAHPFHIHVNPFQVIEVFDPNDPAYQFSDPDGPCYVDPSNKATWRPCRATELGAPYQWRDTFAIPAARQDKATGNRKIDGHFTMRSRFADYTGQFVIHCHILGHEDRGMMQLVAVVSKAPLGPHH